MTVAIKAEGMKSKELIRLVKHIFLEHFMFSRLDGPDDPRMTKKMSCPLIIEVEAM